MKRHFQLVLNACLKPVAIALSIAMLLACTSPEDVEQQLVGYWWGEEPSGFAWCAHYGPDSELELTSYMPTQRSGDDGDMRDAAELEVMAGRWEVEQGLRLALEFGTRGRYLKVEGEIDYEETAEELQATASKRYAVYFVESVGQSEMRYRDAKREDKWFVSSRVDQCPDKFLVPAAGHTG